MYVLSDYVILPLQTSIWSEKQEPRVKLSLTHNVVKA